MQVKKLSEYATIPTRGTSGSAGFDLSCAHETVIPARDLGICPTDLAISVPYGTYGRLALRSGFTKRNKCNIASGVIDFDYIGPVMVVVFNHSDVPVRIPRGERFAQIILEKIDTSPQVQEVQELSATQRGSGGFGSTG